MCVCVCVVVCVFVCVCVCVYVCDESVLIIIVGIVVIGGSNFDFVVKVIF